MISTRWFGLSAPLWWIPFPWKQSRRIPLRLFTCFNRQSHELNNWGVGLLSIDGCHLFYVGKSGIRILFVKVAKWGQA